MQVYEMDGCDQCCWQSIRSLLKVNINTVGHADPTGGVRRGQNYTGVRSEPHAIWEKAPSMAIPSHQAAVHVRQNLLLLLLILLHCFPRQAQLLLEGDSLSLPPAFILQTIPTEREEEGERLNSRHTDISRGRSDERAAAPLRFVIKH